uniref:Cold shock domain-containing protein n=1 Tax=Pundamilia nyererei TaxID=303518 RepID=A0A3B4G420_9CICH
MPAAEPAPTAAAAPTTPTTPAPTPKPEVSTISKALGLLGKRTFEKPPPGRSTGIISFIGPTFGYIMREDLEKFNFSFDAFFGNPKAMTAGVRVHFTACKEKNSSIATDVKVAPGGTENLDPEIYEAVVCQPIMEPQPGERQYPGQVYVTIGPVRRNLPFDRKDSTVTLLKNDQVLINLLTDIITEKTRATNIKPKIPATFSHTKEIREKGVIVSLKETEGVIKRQDDTELAFETKENFSDVEFTQEDINEEVEFTIIQLRAGKRAVRIQRVKEPLLLALCTATATAGGDEEDKTENDASKDCLTKPIRTRTKQEIGPNMVLDTELYEGIVSQTIIEPKSGMPGYPGQVHANIGTVRTNVTFDDRDCGVTLLKNDHVLINLLIDTVTRKRRAANIKPKVPFTFKYTKEERELGIITSLGPEVGILKSEKHGELPFDVCENFSDTEFNGDDVQKEVEFTTIQVKSNTRAIRLRRTKKIEDPILYEQKKRDEEERKKEEEERKKRKEEKSKKREEEEEECERELERKKKEEVAAALAAAKDKWTPLGFTMRDPDTLDDISKERFEGTILKSIPRHPPKTIKKELEEKEEATEEEQGAADAGQVQIKVEKMEEGEKGEVQGGQEVTLELKKEKTYEEVTKEKPPVAEVKTKSDVEVGRLVMTIDGQQKQLTFGPKDLLTTATMLDGDKVRFNIATHRETKEERATCVEILHDSFEESTEQRQHGIVIEFLEDSGLIKCTQNPQLFFHMSEVIEKKKLELNEKIEFSIVPHETADGGVQAIRIKRYTESVFLPVRKLGGVGANKGKMTIKLTKATEEKEKPEAEKLKAVVKNLRAQDSKTNKKDYSATRRRYSRSQSRSRSRSPSRDQFGRIKKRCSSSVEREHRSSRQRRSRERLHKRTRSRSKSRSRSRSRSKSSSRSRSRSRERSKDRASKRRSKTNRDHEENHKRRRELSPPPRRGGIVDDELARKKRELEELNEMIAYKKSLVDPRGLEPGQRTCIDYDHGRIAVPLAEYKPVRSILKKRPDGPEYLHRPPYDDVYYDRPYSAYQDRSYSDPYATRPYADQYGDRPYSDRSYESHLYSESPYGGPPSTSRRYTDRYDVYDEPYDDRYYDPAYVDRPYDPYPPAKRSHSPEPRGLSPPSHAGKAHTASTHPPLSHSAATSSCQTSFRPPSPIDSPPRSPSPKLKEKKSRLSPPTEKPPLDRFLDMLNRKVDAEKNLGPVHVNDDLLPHERALQDGKGFSRIVGLAQEPPSISLAQEGQKRPPSPKRSSVEKTNEDPKTEPYDKIQSLLRTIGLKLSTGEVSKLASQAQEKVFSPRSSTERDTSSAPREELRTTRTGSLESDRIHSHSPVRSSSLEPLSRQKTNVSEYEDFLDQQELEAFKKAQQLQSLTKTMGSTATTTPSPKPPSGPPPAHYRHPTPPFNWPLGVTAEILPTQTSTSSMVTQTPPAAGTQFQTLGKPPGPPPGPPPRRPGQPPPGPPPGPPPRRHPGQPPFSPPSNQSVLPFIEVPDKAPPLGTTSPTQPLITTVVLPPSSTLTSSSPVSTDHSAISTTVARCLKVIETVKSLAVQSPAKPVKSVQFSLPTEPPLVETEDDIKLKQKEKLDLYNQRLLEKREQEFKEMLARKKQGETSKDGLLISSGIRTSVFKIRYFILTRNLSLAGI